MAFDERQKARVARHLANFDFATLFREELGWDSLPAGTQPLTMTLDARTYTLTPVIQKREFTLFVCTADDGSIPLSNERNKIETWLAKRNREHLLIFIDGAQSTQEWQWVRRELGQPLRRRGERYVKGQSGERLLQKLADLEIALAEEDDITLVDVAGRVRAAFNVERVTTGFYNNFKAERNAFAAFVEGIAAGGLLDWYVSIMLNRLMFVYFIQKKGFLDNDPNYLQNRLRLLQAERGADQFYSFYRYFLLRLFHEGLGRPERTPELDALLGHIPYLNGGIFQLHEIEANNPNIQIPDEAFERIIGFFDQYEWYLDDRPLHVGNEINPDVLGYIFEKYINNKEMGAYYTKEDITEYICQNTILPFLFDAIKEKCATAFDPGGLVWSLLQQDPDRYIYAAVRHGSEHALPAEIAVGIDDVVQRTCWNTRTPESHGLPTEIWRETVARRQRHAEVRAKLAAGEITQINDLITYNLDIKQFAQDLVENCEGADLLNAIWQALTTVTVLDPTCGSGAFLFAALNILQPLYSAAIERMATLLDEPGFVKLHPNYAKSFRTVLEQIDKHPNRSYFVLKSIMVNNLYGVDIMAEATEICKLRLFLKLAAQVDKNDRRPNLGIEPLPDIDFNIRAGNTLVGFATQDEVRNALTKQQEAQPKLLLTPEESDALTKIEAQAAAVERLTKKFREQQTTHGGEVTGDDKQALRAKLQELEAILNRYLAQEYGVDPDNGAAFAKWLSSHQPFHWFTEFYGIVQERGGFDVIVGNPPYVEMHKVKKQYQPLNFKLSDCGNIYAPLMEVTHKLNQQVNGRTGLIVPMSLVCTARMARARQELFLRISWVSCFDMRPSSLFQGVAQRLCIVLSNMPQTEATQLYTGDYRRWNSSERDALFALTYYVTNSNTTDLIPKFGSFIEEEVNKKLLIHKRLDHFVARHQQPIFVHRIVRYFVKAINFVPLYVDAGGKQGRSADYKPFCFQLNEQNSIAALLNASLFYWYWRSHSDGFHCGYGDVYLMPYSSLTENGKQKLNLLLDELKSCLLENSLEKTIATKLGIIRYAELSMKPAMKILNEIDTVLAKHYGFSAEELDFIINYDIKYRMGDALFADGVDGDSSDDPDDE